MKQRDARSQGEERQSFLLELSDALRAEPDADAIVARAVRMLVEKMALDRCYATAMYPAEDRVDVVDQVQRPDLAPMPALLRFSDFPEAGRRTFDRTLVFDDTANDPELTDTDKSSLAAMRFGALLSASVRRGSRNPIWALGAVSTEPRRWTPAEIALIEEVTERTWAAAEHARAEAALRESEEKYRTLFETMGQGYCELELLRDANGRAVDQLYIELNPAYERLIGISVADAKGRTASEVMPDLDPRWTEAFDRIATRGEAERIEHEVASLGRWFEVFVYPRGGDRLTVLYEDVTERKRAEDVLRQSEERLSAELSRTQLLQRLSTRLIPEQSPDVLHEQILDAALELMQADAVSIQLLEDGGQRLRRLATRNLHPASTEYWTWVDAGHASTCGQALRTNGRVIAEDVEASAELVGTGDLEAFRRSGTRAVQSTPLVSRSGRPIGMISTHWHEPRRLAEMDFGLFDILARQTADLIERSQSEAALRASEERFRQFADASSDGLWIRDAATLDMEYVSPAVGTIYGLEPDALLGGVSRWLARIVPDDREVAAEHLERARGGNAVEHEFRITRGSDGAVRWIRNTDFPLRDEAGTVRRIGGIAEDVTDDKQAADRQQVLVSELQHRTRNLIAVVRALIERTLRAAGSLDDFRGRFGHRLEALSRVQGLLSHLAAGEKIGFDELLTAELSALGAIDGEGDRVQLDGPADVPLRSSTVQTFALALHELATNAVKYGALSPANPKGSLVVQWRVDTCDDGARWLRVTWRETGVAMPEGGPPPRGGGYGRELIERALPYQLGADTSFDLCPTGVHCTIAVPIAGG